MTPRFTAILGSLAFLVTFAGSANATMIYDITDDSLHGATGSLTITMTDPGEYDVTWYVDFTGYEGSNGNHMYLTEVAWKATGFENISDVSLDPAYAGVGDFFYPSNVNNGGCSALSPASFACVTLAMPGVDATNDGDFTVVFNVLADGFDPNVGISYSGAFGPENGWVISAESGGVVPEPTAAVVFGLGMLVMGSQVHRQRR